MVKTIKEMIKELEKEIIKINLSQRCLDFENECVQCQFWEKFDWIKKKLEDCDP